MTEKDKAALTPCWYVKDYADGWIKFYDQRIAIETIKETGAILIYSHDGSYPQSRATLAPAVVEPVSGAVPDGYIYEYDGQPGCGVHRSLKNEFWNGQYADRSIPYYIAAPEPEKAQKPSVEEMYYAIDRVWRWVERAKWDKVLGMQNCIDTLIHNPIAPWNVDREAWDTRHK